MSRNVTMPGEIVLNDSHISRKGSKGLSKKQSHFIQTSYSSFHGKASCEIHKVLMFSVEVVRGLDQEIEKTQLYI